MTEAEVQELLRSGLEAVTRIKQRLIEMPEHEWLAVAESAYLTATKAVEDAKSQAAGYQITASGLGDLLMFAIWEASRLRKAKGTN
jgi:hypothetical protein